MGKLKKYSLHFDGIGGEFVIGKVSRTVADYWRKKGAEAFNEYHTRDDPYEQPEDVPKKFQLPSAYDLDQIRHSSGPVLPTGQDQLFLVLRDVQAREYFSEVDLSAPWVMENAYELPEPDAGVVGAKEVRVHAQFWERGKYTYGILELDKRPEIKKFKFHVRRHGQDEPFFVIDYITYDDIKLHKIDYVVRGTYEEAFLESDP